MWSLLGLFVFYGILHPSGAQITHISINLYPEEMFYLAITGNYEEPLYMEAKAYCAAYGYLSYWLMLKGDLEALPIYNSDTNETESTLSDKSQRWISPLFENFVQYNKFAVREDLIGKGVWTNYTFKLSQTAKLNISEYAENKAERKRRTHYANQYYKTNLLWLEQTGALSEKKLEEIQGRLNERHRQLKSENHKVFIPGLDKLFKKSRLSKDLFTPETEAYVQTNKPRLSHANAYKFVSSFTVKGCAEQPKDNVNNRIIIAMEGDLKAALISVSLLEEEDF